MTSITSINQLNNITKKEVKYNVGNKILLQTERKTLKNKYKKWIFIKLMKKKIYINKKRKWQMVSKRKIRKNHNS